MPSVGHAKRVQSWKRRYGITEADYQRMLTAQGGVCRVCGGPPDTVDGLLHIDHDHSTGAVRGLLCKGCNTALGNIRDNPETAARISDYLRENEPPPEALPPPVDAVAVVPKERPAEQRGKAYLTDKDLKDARLPKPEMLVAMQQAGLDRKQIAEELGLSTRTTKALFNEAQRRAGLEAVRDILLRDVIANAVAKVKMGVELDSDGQYSLEFLTKMGAFPKDAPNLPVSQGGGFEEWRMSVTKRTYADTTNSGQSTEVETVTAPAILPASVGEASAPAEKAAPGASPDYIEGSLAEPEDAGT